MKIAIFDFNGTIFPKETMPFILSQWYKLNYSKIKLVKVFLPLFPLYIKYKMGINNENISKEDMERQAVKGVSELFRGMKKSEVNEFFHKAEISASRYYNNEITKKIDDTNKKGYHTVLLSGAFKPLLINVKKRFKIDTVIGSEFTYKNEKFSSLKESDIISGSKKMERLQQILGKREIDWSRSCAFADSFHDLPLFKKVGNPVVVEPDENLASIAQKRNWEVIQTD